ncbi:hypothetical protein MMC32_005021 [Xylographa parallela]|nr:hypothetical protein [Xylographa parallela]
MAFIGGKRRMLLIVIALGFCIIIANLLALPGADIRSTINKVPFPGKTKPSHNASADSELGRPYVPVDDHPISKLIAEADQTWRQYDSGRSMTFKETVSKYRRRYGRHPPPRFQEWYKFARERHVYNIDDFDQIMDDLRPFWAIEPTIIRRLAAHMWEVDVDGIAGIHIRNKTIVSLTNRSWRSETMQTLIERFIDHIPDMDIALNRFDQPRVVVPWDDMQGYLDTEMYRRQMLPEAYGEFTTNMNDLLNTAIEHDDSPREVPGWYGAAGRQYMEIAKTACPPESHANERGPNQAAAEARYKSRLGGVVSNFNLSSDLCTIGPEIQDKHGFLFSASSISATKRLVPVFGECKVNVNSDILFPASMYWMHDERYEYDDRYDVDWDDKDDIVIWRGATSGGGQVEDSWRRLHRHRLVLLLNGTEMHDQTVRILAEQPEAEGEYENFRQFSPSQFALQHADVAFTDAFGCFPNCSYLYDNVLALAPRMDLYKQFKYKFLVDVDGHSFSGRWRAFLESRSLGIKATIFREWHDSRLFAWRHFVPMDNRFDDIYTLLTYFIGSGDPQAERLPGVPYVAKHDAEGRRIAQQGREWANKVLRHDDIEIYMFRLLLEYGRIIDDNRDRIGYSGDGSELDKYDSSRDHV